VLIAQSVFLLQHRLTISQTGRQILANNHLTYAWEYRSMHVKRRLLVMDV